MTDLFAPGKLGPYELANRIVMAPMTRHRASDDFVPQPISTVYYAQRASAGLIVTEASQVSRQGAGYPRTPGIYSAEQIRAWQEITRAVHARGSRIFLQLWHAGRISHPSVQPGGGLPVAPSAIAAEGVVHTPAGMQPYVVPRALTTGELAAIVQDYRAASGNAMAAGFDGVELHAANGYLIDQFLRNGSNVRADQYGGSIANRCRLLFEILDAVTEVWGAGRVGVRLSPLVDVHSVSDTDPQALFSHIAGSLGRAGLSYLHVFESVVPHPTTPSAVFDLTGLRRQFAGTYIANGGYDLSRAEEAVRGARADFVSFGRLFLANPDLPHRLRHHLTLNKPDVATFYEGGERGYTDYASASAP